MASCTHNGTEFASGVVICIEGTEHRCKGDGTWENLRQDCVQGDGIVVRTADGVQQLPSD